MEVGGSTSCACAEGIDCAKNCRRHEGGRRERRFA